MADRVVHFEINSPDPEAAAAFYSKAFGWTVQKWEGPSDYWLVTTGEEGTAGIDGAIMHPQGGGPGTVNTINVASVDDALERVTAGGGMVAAAKMMIPGIGYAAYCVDPTGVTFGVFEDDKNAA